MPKSIVYLNREEIVEFVRTLMLQDVESALDIGCGIHPQNYVFAKKNYYIEPYDEYIKILQTMVPEDSVILEGTWQEKIDEIPDNGVESIIITDVIEHLYKEDGEKVLKITEQKATKQILVMTPFGFVPQDHTDGIDAWGLGGGTWQEHKSGWLPEDFDDSWDCYVCLDFHQQNNMGIWYDEPKGIIYAIKNK